MYIPDTRERGFTLIELSIVLVIIGLIVGGVLVGQELIRAAGIRAQITQIEKFNQAATVFFEKYGYLPGDISDPTAKSFGLQARGNVFGTNAGQGDGNGVIQGQSSGNACSNCPADGESVAFWVDLSAARLIDGGFTTMAWNGGLTNPNGVFPEAKIGGGNYVYVWSGGTTLASGVMNDRRNYFGLSAVTSMYAFYATTGPSPGLTVQQASAVDTKIDDGLPQKGNVVAFFPNGSGWPNWAAGGGNTGATGSSPATPGSATTCYDNSATASGTPGVAATTQHYSLEMSGGTNNNCALSFKMQAGD